MNRADRLRKVAPGAPDELIESLATGPAAQVDRVVALARQARRDEREHQAERKRQRKADDKKHRNYDVEELAGRNLRMLDATARYGGLDALRWLGESAKHIEWLKDTTMADLRRKGYSDTEIGSALGMTRQAVGQRIGRKQGFTQERRPGAAS